MSKDIEAYKRFSSKCPHRISIQEERRPAKAPGPPCAQGALSCTAWDSERGQDRPMTLQPSKLCPTKTLQRLKSASTICACSYSAKKKMPITKEVLTWLCHCEKKKRKKPCTAFGAERRTRRGWSATPFTMGTDGSTLAGRCTASIARPAWKTRTYRRRFGKGI